MSDDGIGSKDRVSVTLNGEMVLVSESYDVRVSILTQPSAFSLRLGWGDVAKALLKKFEPNQPFELSINGRVQQTGAVDDISADDDSGATLVTIGGRDVLAPLHDGYVRNDVAFKGATYEQMVERALKEVGSTVPFIVSNTANRTKTSGAGAVETAAPVSAQTVVKSPSGPIQARVGERWYDFLRKHFDRAGLVLWATGDGSIVLSNPNGKQKPSYVLVRKRGALRNAVNAVKARFKNATAHRFSEVIIYGRGGGKKFGRTRATGNLIDAEMRNWGFERPLVARDMDSTTIVQAERLAERKLAETRNAGWKLTYIVSGHTLPTPSGGTAVIVPDTIVQVTDDEYGFSGPYYIESVAHRSAPTTTEITLMRPDDLLFGEGE